MKDDIKEIFWNIIWFNMNTILTFVDKVEAPPVTGLKKKTIDLALSQINISSTARAIIGQTSPVYIMI